MENVHDLVERMSAVEIPKIVTLRYLIRAYFRMQNIKKNLSIKRIQNGSLIFAFVIGNRCFQKYNSE